MKEEIIYIQDMESPRDIMLVSQELESLGVRVKSIELGTAAYINLQDRSKETIERALKGIGYRVVEKSEKEFADNVKLFIGMYLEKIGACMQVPLLSSFLEEQMGVAYATISKRFRKIENLPVGKYFIRLKMGKVKNMLQSTDMSIKDISACLNYSNPRSLARKFREETGFSLNDFKSRNLMMFRMASE